MYKLATELPRRSSARRWLAIWLRRGWRTAWCIPREAVIWTVGLLAMAATDPTAPPLLDLCLFDALGISFCPGCGLGHAIAWLARGDVVASFRAHPLGLPAAGFLLYRIVYLIRHP